MSTCEEDKYSKNIIIFGHFLKLLRIFYSFNSESLPVKLTAKPKINLENLQGSHKSNQV